MAVEDRSPRAANLAPRTGEAELSNYETVNHWFDLATDRMGLYREAAPALGLTPSETRVAVQGFGNVGAWAARIIAQLGCRVIGASDANGAVYSEAGLDPHALHDFVREGGKLPEYDRDGAQAISPHELLGLECEVLIPAALGGMIHRENARRREGADDQDEREVNEKLGTAMRRAYREVTARAKEEDAPLRVAAYETGIERVVEAARTRGYIE